MNSAMVLLLAQTALIFVSAISLRGEKKIFVLFMILIYIYSAIPLFIYQVAPVFSMALGAYFGEDVVYKVHAFVFSSQLLIYIFARVTNNSYNVGNFKIKFFKIAKYNYLWLLMMFMMILIWATKLWDNLTYSNIQDESMISPELFAFVFCNKMSVLLLVSIYAYLYTANANFRLKLAYFVSLSIFTIISIRIGSRADLVNLVIGIIVVHLTSSNRPLVQVNLIKYGLIAFLVVPISIIIQIMRSKGSMALDDLSFDTLIVQDNFAPIHVLIAAIFNDTVDPVRVIASNSLNFFIGSSYLFGEQYPFLTEIITEKINTSHIVTRTQGFASHIFLEGWMFAGVFGFIYNGLIIVVMINIYRIVASCVQHDLKPVVLGMLGSTFLLIIRSQSIISLRYLLIFVPIILIIHCVFIRSKVEIEQPRSRVSR